MAFKGLFILLVAVYTNCVTCNEVNHKHYDGKKPDVEARYQFNHPPLTEYYNPIPVAIVYEDKHTLRSEISTKTLEDVEVKVTTETNVPKPKERKQLNTTVERSAVPKSRSLKDLQIPVAVVYETDPNKHHSTRSNTRSPKRHLNNRTKQQIKTNTDDQTTESIEKIEKKDSNVGTKIFKKRTGGRDPIVPIVESESYVFSHSGNFHYRYEGGDGTKAYSEGKLKKLEDDTGESVVGGFSYTDKDGNDFSLSYTADENGYRPIGAHLPTPPPIPPAIARALAYLATVTPAPTTERSVKSKAPIE